MIHGPNTAEFLKIKIPTLFRKIRERRVGHPDFLFPEILLSDFLPTNDLD